MEKVLIITGAAGGLGQAIVSLSLNVFRDMMVVAADTNLVPLKIFEGHNRLLPVKLDVTSEKDIVSLRRMLEDRGLMAWGIVNNAGISAFFPVSERDRHSLEEIFAVNTFGPVNMVRAFLSHLIKMQGRVVQISSESIRLPALFHPYAASKTAMEALSVCMRNELALHGIRLCMVRPGAINTPMLNDLYDMKNNIGKSVYSDALRLFAERAPGQIRRTVETHEVAGLVIKALSAKNPKSYYHINNNFKLRLAQHLPHWLRDRLMQAMLRKPF